MTTLALIGLGNRWRRDDAVGLMLVDALALSPPEGVVCYTFESCDALTLAHELLEIDAPSLVVDCADMGLAPGTGKFFRASEVRLSGARSTHGFGIAESIPLVRQLGFTHPIAFFGVQPYSLDLADSCSETMVQRMPALTAELKAQLAAWSSHRAGTGTDG